VNKGKKDVKNQVSHRGGGVRMGNVRQREDSRTRKTKKGRKIDRRMRLCPVPAIKLGRGKDSRL